MTSEPGASTVVGRFSIDATKPVGCTRWLHGSELGFDGTVVPVIGKLIPAEGLEQFLMSEGTILHALAAHPHPNLPQLRATAEDETGQSLAVMNATFGDLHAHLRMRHKLSEVEARSLFAQLVAAVAHCHSLNIVLRDLKLGNIFFSDDARTTLTLLDLSAACVVSPENPLLCGATTSPAYMAPEVMSGQLHDGSMADVWALGVVLHLLLVGSYPFHDPSPAALLQRIRLGGDSLPYPAHLSRDARALIARMLHRHAAMRPSAADVLADPWFQVPSPSLRRAFSLPAHMAHMAAASAPAPMELDTTPTAVPDQVDQVVPCLAAQASGLHRVQSAHVLGAQPAGGRGALFALGEDEEEPRRPRAPPRRRTPVVWRGMGGPGEIGGSGSGSGLPPRRPLSMHGFR